GVLLWDAATGRVIACLRDAPGKNSSVDAANAPRQFSGIGTVGPFSPDGTLLPMGTMAGAVYLWDVAARKNRGTIQAHAGAVGAIAFAPDGKTLATAGRDGQVRLWKRTVAAYPEPAPGDDGPKPAELFLVRATVEVKHTDVVQAPTDMLTDLAFAPDGKSFAATNQNRLIRLWKF